MQWARGNVANLRADFVANDDMTNVELVLHDPSGDVVDPGVPTEVQTNSYVVDWTVPEDAELGFWEARWVGTVGTQTLGGSEFFEVVDAGFVVPGSEVVQLRNLVDRAITGVEPFFTDDELHTLLSMTALNVWAAASQGWLIKAGVYAESIDLTEGGAERRLSQKYKNALAMYKLLSDKVTSDHAAGLSDLRTGAKVISLRKDVLDPLGVLSSGFQTGDAMFVRTYPLKRFNSILR
jgi:hypothetical protein